MARHGQTAANASGLLLGRADPELNELGRLQAERLGAALGDASRVVTSPLRRARETAACLGRPVTVDERWIELDYGVYDGVPLGEVPAAVWQQWRSDPGWSPPGGESLVDVGQRVMAACQSLAEEAAAVDVVVVTHVSPLKAAVAWALNVGPEVAWRMYVEVASISRVAVGPRGPALRSFNETGHLAAPVEQRGPATEPKAAATGGGRSGAGRSSGDASDPEAAGGSSPG